MTQYSAIYPGKMWLDTSGKPIQAHGGVLTIDTKHAEAFNEALLNCYDTTDTTMLKTVLRECIKTM